MRKVYCLKEDNCGQDDAEIHAVFSSEKLAIEYAKTLPNSYVVERDLDPTPDPLLLSLASTKEDLWKVRMHWNGNLDSMAKITHDPDRRNTYGYETLWTYPHERDGEIPDFFVIVRAKTRKEAIELANDYRLKYLEENH